MSNYEREVRFCDKMGIDYLNEIFDYSPDDIMEAIMAEDYQTRYYLFRKIIEMAGEM